MELTSAPAPGGGGGGSEQNQGVYDPKYERLVTVFNCAPYVNDVPYPPGAARLQVRGGDCSRGTRCNMVRLRRRELRLPWRELRWWGGGVCVACVLPSNGVGRPGWVAVWVDVEREGQMGCEQMGRKLPWGGCRMRLQAGASIWRVPTAKGGGPHVLKWAAVHGLGPSTPGPLSPTSPTSLLPLLSAARLCLATASLPNGSSMLSPFTSPTSPTPSCTAFPNILVIPTHPPQSSARATPHLLSTSLHFSVPILATPLPSSQPPTPNAHHPAPLRPGRGGRRPPVLRRRRGGQPHPAPAPPHCRRVRAAEAVARSSW